MYTRLKHPRSMTAQEIESLRKPSNEGVTTYKAKDGSMVAYVYTLTPTKAVIKAFKGKSLKPYYFYSIKPEALPKKLEQLFKDHESIKSFRAEQKAKANAPHKFQEGHILRSSWGYDQTNIDSYQVTAVLGPHMIEIRPIASQNVSSDGPSMTGKCVPAPDAFTGAAMRKRVSYGGVSVGCARASLWDGRIDNWTAYA
jgi:hypothetical protein